MAVEIMAEAAPHIDPGPVCDEWGAIGPSAEMEESLMRMFADETPQLDAAQEEALELAFEVTMLQCRPAREFQELTHDEALQRFTLSKSASYPYSNRHACKGDFLEAGRATELLRYYDELLAGQQPPALFSCFIKKERRKQKKVLQGAGHLIVTCGITHLYGCFRLLGWLMDDWVGRPATKTDEWYNMLGMTKTARGWHDFQQRLRSRGAIMGYAMDQMHQDKHVNRRIWEYFIRYVLTVVPEDVRGPVRWLLVTARDNLIVGARGDVYAKVFGNSSGWALTALLATFASMLCTNYAFVRILRLRALEALTAREIIRARFQVGTAGDDLVIADKEATLEAAEELRAAGSELGIVWKHEGETPCMLIEDLPFLSARSRRLPTGEWVHVPVGDKLLAGWFIHSPAHSGLERLYQRALSYRIEAWWQPGAPWNKLAYHLYHKARKEGLALSAPAPGPVIDRLYLRYVRGSAL